MLRYTLTYSLIAHIQIIKQDPHVIWESCFIILVIHVDQTWNSVLKELKQIDTSFDEIIIDKVW